MLLTTFRPAHFKRVRLLGQFAEKDRTAGADPQSEILCLVLARADLLFVITYLDLRSILRHRISAACQLLDLQKHL